VINRKYIKDVILKDPDYKEKLLDHLPEGQKDLSGLRDTLLSP